MTRRGKPEGSHTVESGSLMSASYTARGPLPGLKLAAFCLPHSVHGALSWPGPAMPAPPASQVPEMSRFGAAGAVGLCAASAVFGHPPLFQSCARAAPDHAHVAVTTT